jgi:hypothetical protein
MYKYCVLLLIRFPFVVPEAPSCNLLGQEMLRTLLFHTYYIPVQALSLGHALTTITPI